MRTSMHTTVLLLARTALALALASACTRAGAADQSADGASARASVDRLKGTDPVIDPKYVAGWQRFCADQPERGGCEVILQRLGRKAVVGVLLAPDAGGGVRIAGVTPDGAAGAAGIKSGDRLLRIGGRTIEGATPEERVENARKLLQNIDENTAVKLRYARGDRETDVEVKPHLDTRIMVFSGDGTMMRPDGNVVVRRIGSGTDMPAGAIDVEVHGVAPAGAGQDMQQVFVFNDGDTTTGADGQTHVDRRVIRIDCKGDQEECRKQAHERMMHAPLGIDPARMNGPQDIQARVFRFDCAPGEACAGQQRLAEAFRWNGLNLASVDAQLGRYFGTDKGVLVLSTGPTLGQLQAGDVIQRVDGKAVATPRAVMDALRDKPEDSSVAVDYLRDRTSGATRIKVPKAMAFPALPQMPPVAPMAPMPPMPPHPSKAGAGQQATGGAATVTQRRIVIVDKDGRTQTWEDDGDGPMPALPVPAAPPVPPPHVD